MRCVSVKAERRCNDTKITRLDFYAHRGFESLSSTSLCPGPASPTTPSSRLVLPGGRSGPGGNKSVDRERGRNAPPGEGPRTGRRPRRRLSSRWEHSPGEVIPGTHLGPTTGGHRELRDSTQLASAGPVSAWVACPSARAPQEGVTVTAAGVILTTVSAIGPVLQSGKPRHIDA